MAMLRPSFEHTMQTMGTSTINDTFKVIRCGWALLKIPMRDRNIVACQRGGVSNKQDTGSGILWSVHRWTKTTREPPTCGTNQDSSGF